MLKIKIIILCIWAVLRSAAGYSHGDEAHEEKKVSEAKTQDSSEGKKENENISSESLSIVNKGYQSVLPIFREACFDCHSNETKYPWYSKLPFVSHLIEHDVEDAKKHLIMGNTFPFAGHGTPLGDLKAIEKSIIGGKMPPFRYQIMHWEAFLNEKEKAKIFEWVTNAKQTIKK